jgi:hypothetical protein
MFPARIESRNGVNVWHIMKSVDLYGITLKGCVPLKKDVPVTGGTLVLSLGKDEAVSIVPAGTRLTGKVLK